MKAGFPVFLGDQSKKLGSWKVCAGSSLKRLEGCGGGPP